MKCQAQVERVTGRANLRRVVAQTAYGRCTRNAVATLGRLCLCTQHIKLALDGLVNKDGVVVERGALRDVRRYPHKFPHGLYQWARDLKPEPLPLPPAPPDPDPPRVLDTGEGRVLVGFTPDELRYILNFVPTRSIRERCITALGLLDPASAKEFTVDL